jgi:hypothetical protein
MKSILFLLLLLPFCLCAENNCDTVFTFQQAKTEYASSLDSLGFDTTDIAYINQTPKYYLYKSKRPSDNGAYRFAVKDGKQWKSWVTNIHHPDMGTIKCNRKDVNGGGESELIIWELHVWGHHSSSFMEEIQDYTVHIWDITTATEIFRYTYLQKHRYADFSVDTIAYTDVDIAHKVTINVGQILLKKERYYLRDTVSGDFYTCCEDTNCSKTNGTYRLNGNMWIRSNEPYYSKTVDVKQPKYEPYWVKKTPPPPTWKQRFKEKWKNFWGKLRRKKK